MIYGERIINEGKIKDAILGDNISREMAKWNAESMKLLEKNKWNDSDIAKAKQLIEQYDSDNKKWKSGNYYKLYSSNIDNYYERLKAKIPEDKFVFKNKGSGKTINPEELYNIHLTHDHPDLRTEKGRDELINDVKYIERELYKSNKFIKDVESFAQKRIDENFLGININDFKPSISGHPLVPKMTAECDYENGQCYICVLDNHNQTVRIAMCEVIVDTIGWILEGKYGDYDTGDGDEGCIYYYLNK